MCQKCLPLADYAPDGALTAPANAASLAYMAWYPKHKIGKTSRFGPRLGGENSASILKRSEGARWITRSSPDLLAATHFWDSFSEKRRAVEIKKIFSDDNRKVKRPSPENAARFGSAPSGHRVSVMCSIIILILWFHGFLH